MIWIYSSKLRIFAFLFSSCYLCIYAAVDEIIGVEIIILTYHVPFLSTGEHFLSCVQEAHWQGGHFRVPRILLLNSVKKRDKFLVSIALSVLTIISPISFIRSRCPSLHHVCWNYQDNLTHWGGRRQDPIISCYCSLVIVNEVQVHYYNPKKKIHVFKQPYERLFFVPVADIKEVFACFTFF